ncbi:MAG: thioredoxin family protein [Bacillota bacterium]|jgi:small redox-active disulfide protein 2|uniref:Thioredoxin family protein n=1 Tax=Thermanaerosceptrum fracticalcis TaxID=1712410 RepID=A0A7G6E7W5_THEFR|nr:thioredoxin family protein [Thermanaerosceptrum fracticalcis]QNB48169.1 thioredoxin family protein [Thermanaerosceptrum fracticalcis]
MKIKVYGPGCMNCTNLEKEVINALAELDMAANVEKVTDIKAIVEAGIMMTPGLVINGKVKSYGRVPRREEIKKFINEEL